MGGGSGSGAGGLSAAAAQTMVDANLALPIKGRGGSHGRPPHPLGHCVSYDDHRLRQASSEDEETAATSDMTGSIESGRGGAPDRNVYKASSSSTGSRRRLPGGGTMGRRQKQSDSSSAPHHVPKGLKNVGNTCYANAALQCLLSTALTHALLDPTQAVLFRRYSSNPNILAQGSGSVDSDDEDYELDLQIGLSVDDDRKELPPSMSEEEKEKKREKRRLKREARRKEKEKLELRETCRWLTGELTDITREYTTFGPPKQQADQPQPPPPPSGLLGLLSIGGHSPLSHRDRKSKVVDPGEITRNVHKLSQTLRPYQQEDAHEFLRSLLSTLTMEGQNRQLSSLFDGLLESSVTCQTCEFSSLTRDRYMDLSLDIADNSINTLTDALHHFTKTETLDQNNMVECRKCQERRIVTKGLRLATAPTILVCHLKRFAWNAYGQQIRLSKGVAFPLQLDIDKCMSKANRSTPPPYELVGVLVHAGRSCDSGHYYSFVKSGDRWYKCNDATVTEVNVGIVLRQNAYMLVYEVEGMRQNHDCESYGKYHPAPKPAPTADVKSFKAKSSSKTSKSKANSSKKRNKRKGHFRSQSAPRPVREPSPFRQPERFPFASSPPDKFLPGDRNASEANESSIASALTNVLNACAAAGDSICGFSTDVDKGFPQDVSVEQEPSWDPEVQSQCSDDEGLALKCIPATADSTCCSNQAQAQAEAQAQAQDTSTKAPKPPLSPPKPSKKSVQDVLKARGESTDQIPSLVSDALNSEDKPTSSSSKVSGMRKFSNESRLGKARGSSLSNAKSASERGFSSSTGETSGKKYHRRRKKKHHHLHHDDDDADRSVSDSEERGHRLKGLDILKKKGREGHRRSKERPPRPFQN